MFAGSNFIEMQMKALVGRIGHAINGLDGLPKTSVDRIFAEA